MNKKLRCCGCFILLAISFAFFSCSKSTDDKLTGIWKVVNVVHINDTTSVEKWQFDHDGNLKIYFYTNSSGSSLPRLVLKYKVVSYRKLSISSNDSVSFTQNWQIIKLNKEILIMTCVNGGLEQKEFVKM